MAPDSSKLPNPLRGEVWLVEFEPARGAEMRKTRPALVVSLDSVGKLPLRLVVPFTSWQAEFSGAPWLIPIEATKANGLTSLSAADTFQTRSFWTGRFVQRLGALSPLEIETVVRALAASVGAC